ncbi:MAG: hypothetical protein RL015_1683 [Verrucomicrobiota bacterium]|jgi:hypothetical protein
MKRFFSCFFLVLTSLPILSLAAPTPDDQARFLAGLNVDGTDLEPQARESGWEEHAAEFHRAWSDLEARQLAPIRTWMPSALGYIHADPSPLFYFFSGPDFLYANAFYPQARAYILCGQEPVGQIPDVAALSGDSRSAALKNLRKALNAILSYSFFITADMKSDLTQTQLSGTLPILYVFLARMGCHITQVELIRLNDLGEISAEKSNTPGVKIDFVGTSGQPQTLYYFTSDLSNWGIKKSPGFISFCQKQGQGNALVKAASYLMHLNEFSSARDYLLTNTRNVIQDDSGVPWRFFKQQEWLLNLYGNYPGPISLFAKHDQPDLRAAFKTSRTGDLPFGVGYQWRPGVSSIIVGTALRSVPKAHVVAEPVPE